MSNRKRTIRTLGAIPLLGLLATAVPHAETERVHLGPARLVEARGAGFWDDPCTYDGYAVGGGAVLCFLGGSAGGCLAMISGAFKAYYVDNCF